MVDYGGHGNDTTDRYRLNAGRLWASGAATALVAALVAVVGLLVARGLFRVAVLAPRENGVWGDARTATYAIVSAVAALFATGLLHVLSVAVAEPRTFFRWIMGLLTLIAAIVPLTLGGTWAPEVATALINLAIGLAITVILDNVAAATRVAGPVVRDGTTRSYTRSPSGDW